jgi:hypothetical protein
MGRLFAASMLTKINPMHPNDGYIHWNTNTCRHKALHIHLLITSTTQINLDPSHSPFDHISYIDHYLGPSHFTFRLHQLHKSTQAFYVHVSITSTHINPSFSHSPFDHINYTTQPKLFTFTSWLHHQLHKSTQALHIQLSITSTTHITSSLSHSLVNHINYTNQPKLFTFTSQSHQQHISTLVLQIHLSITSTTHIINSSPSCSCFDHINYKDGLNVA